MAQSEYLSREKRLYAECEDALFRLAVTRFEARRADAFFAEADAGDAELTAEEMDRAFERACPRVLRRIRRERRRANLRAIRCPAVSRVATVAAALLALALIGGISALAVSPQMRASLSRLLVNPEEEFTEFRMSEEEQFSKPVVPDDFEGTFFPSYIPEGFAFKQAFWGGAYYETGDGRTLLYGEYTEDTVMNLDTEDADVSYGEVGGTDAMFVEKNGLSSVVWSFANRYFLVGIMGTPEEAKKVAESVVVIDR